MAAPNCKIGSGAIMEKGNWSILVKQPNDLYARFNQKQQDFTEINLTYDEALVMLMKYMPQTARRMMHRMKGGAGYSNGYGRWKDCIERISRIHGSVYTKDVTVVCGGKHVR